MRRVGLLTLAVVLPACALDPTPLLPPGIPRVNAPALSAVPRARAEITFALSGDDGAGVELVGDYAILRRRQGTSEFLPFNVVKAEDAPDRSAVYHDVSATPGTSYEYVAFALASREGPSIGKSGGRPSPSRPSEPFVAVAPRESGPTIPVAPPTDVKVTDAAHDGRTLSLEFALSSADEMEGSPALSGYAVLRADTADGPFEPIPLGAFARGSNKAESLARVEAVVAPDPEPHFYRVYAIPAQGDAVASFVVRARAARGLISTENPAVAFVVGLSVFLILLFLQRATKAKPMFIRRIPGVDAIEEAVGRATEMGRPVLYVPGIDEIQDIQTIASLLILGRVAELIARYDCEIKVPCCIPLVAAVGEEVVRQGFYDAGRPDAHRPNNIQWISSEQFAFCAGANGIMLRDKPATNIFLGRFFAESLILAETGYVNRAIQIAGTAEITQLPFFIAACDYTLIGEELFAVSAYMSRDPRLLSTLKAADWVKALCIVVLVVGSIAAVAAPGTPFTETLLSLIAKGE